MENRSDMVRPAAHDLTSVILVFPGQAIASTEKDFFAGFETQQLIEEQALARDPRRLMDLTFQPPGELSRLRE